MAKKRKHAAMTSLPPWCVLACCPTVSLVAVPRWMRSRFLLRSRFRMRSSSSSCSISSVCQNSTQSQQRVPVCSTMRVLELCALTLTMICIAVLERVGSFVTILPFQLLQIVFAPLVTQSIISRSLWEVPPAVLSQPTTSGSRYDRGCLSPCLLLC